MTSKGLQSSTAGTSSQKHCMWLIPPYWYENGVWDNKPVDFNYYIYFIGSFTMPFENDIMKLKSLDF